MTVTLEEAKQYLRLDTSDDDELLETIISAAENVCADVARISVEELQKSTDDTYRVSVLYAIAYLYEHREEADHTALVLTVRSLLFGIRKVGF